MAIDTGEYKSKIGLDSLYIALVTEDSATAYTAGTPEYLAPAAEASQEPTQNSETQYADDQAYDVMSSEGETSITLSVTNIPLVTMGTILGRPYDATNGLFYDNGATPPYCALMFRSLKSNGSYRYYAFLKGRFDVPAEAAVTKGETPEPQVLEMVYRAIKTTFEWDLDAGVSDGVKRIIGDDDATGFSGASWFTTVPVPIYSGTT